MSIPVSYTSYLAPLAAPKLWNEVRNNKFEGLKAMETAYVVKLHNVVQLAETQQCFEFVHPNHNWPDHIDNQRFSVREWTGLGGEQGATVHGLGGYFESRLYGDVYISILPGSPNYSEGMFSWFPLYFPLRNPIFAAPGEKVGGGWGVGGGRDRCPAPRHAPPRHATPRRATPPPSAPQPPKLHVHMWRMVSSSRVWYEWAVSTEHHISPVHNPNGRSYWIGL